MKDIVVNQFHSDDDNNDNEDNGDNDRESERACNAADEFMIRMMRTTRMKFWNFESDQNRLSQDTNDLKYG